MASTSQAQQMFANASAADGGDASASGSGVLKLGCTNSGCDIGKIITAIPKRKSSQFITAPYLQEKPIFVNGLTSVFQIQGNAAKLNDIKSLNSTESDTAKPIYRINPDTHVHVINYIVADDECEVVRKISENDPETIRILQDSQRASAKQKLERLKSNHTVKEVKALVTKSGSGGGGSVRVTPLASDLQLSETIGPGKTKASLRNQQSMPPPQFVASTSSSSVAPPPQMAITFDQMQKELRELRQSVAELTAHTKSQ